MCCQGKCWRKGLRERERERMVKDAHVNIKDLQVHVVQL